MTSVEDFRKNAHAMIDFICNYYNNVEKYPVLSNVKPNDIRRKLPTEAPEEPEEFSAIEKDINEIIMPGITHWQHPNFFAYFPTSSSFPAMLGDMLSNGLGIQGMLWITSPACTELETHVMDWLAKIVQLPDVFLSPFCGGTTGGGMIQGSASEVALSALVAARWRKVHQRVPSITNLQTTDLGDLDPTVNALIDEVYSKAVCYVSDQTHSIVRKGCMVAGIRHLRVIPTDENFGMKVDRLKEQIKKDTDNGLIPIFICATLGTTSTGATDPIEEIGKISKDCDAWFHIDAAYAGSFCVLPEIRPMLKGVEEADSFNFNPHKCLLTNFDCSVFWVKDRKSLVDSLTLTPEFLRNKATDAGEVFDYKDWGVPLGRRFRALKLWFVLRMYGVKGVQAHMRKLLDLGTQFESWVVADPRFELVVKRGFSLVCFRLNASNDDNKKLQEVAMAENNIYLTHTVIHGKYTLRMALASGTATLAHVEKAWKGLQDTATKLFPDLGKNSN